jgi:hypothetical protein
MNLEQLIDVQAKQRQGELTVELPFKIRQRRIAKGYLSINGNVVIPVENCATMLDRSSDIPIWENGNEIGYLCFTKGTIVDNLAALTEFHFCCYLNEITSESDLTSEYELKYDYVVIYGKHITNYVSNYLQSAPLWGYFNHKYSGLSISAPLTKTTPHLSVHSFPKFSETYYHETSVRGIKQNSAFERFLKYYHLLELNFDYDVIRRIKNLNLHTESKNIGSILNEYQRGDIERLRYLFNTYCTNLNDIVVKLNEINNHLSVADDIFYEFGKKEANPLRDKHLMHSLASHSDGFTLARCKHVKVPNISDASYATFIGNLSTYWIYRIRCSIAHNKLGEYLMSHNDEKFIVEFGEPLMLEFLKQVFK